MTRLEFALEQIEFARRYTRFVLKGIDEADWSRQPPSAVTHIAWQVGHLTMAQYRLALERIRGPRSEDESLISPDFLAKYGRGSVPDSGADLPLEEIRTVFRRIHEQVMKESAELSDSVLDEAPEQPHQLFDTKFGALLWCAAHELTHAGQISLIRRGLGGEPRW